MKKEMIKLIRGRTGNYIANVASIINLVIETAKAILGQNVSYVLQNISQVMNKLVDIAGSPSVSSIIEFVKSIANVIFFDNDMNNALMAGLDTTNNAYNVANRNVDTFGEIANYSFDNIGNPLSEKNINREIDLFTNAYAKNPVIQHGSKKMSKMGRCYKNVKQFCNSDEYSTRSNEMQNSISKQFEKIILNSLNNDKQFKYLVGYWQEIEEHLLANETDETKKERLKNIVTDGLSDRKINQIAKASNINNVLGTLLGSMSNVDDMFNHLEKIAAVLESDRKIYNSLQLMTTKIVDVLKKDLQRHVDANQTPEVKSKKLTQFIEAMDKMLSECFKYM